MEELIEADISDEELENHEIFKKLTEGSKKEKPKRVIILLNSKTQKEIEEAEQKEHMKTIKKLARVIIHFKEDV